MRRRRRSFCNNILMTMSNLNLDAEALYRTLATQLASALARTENLALVGIYSGGAWLAERLASEMQLTERLGYIDVSFYRDDYTERGLPGNVRPTQIPFEVDDATILLVDDILFTGRTTRAAINELFDYGRPRKIMLAALIDRGGRELPIAADFAAQTVFVPADQSLELKREDGGRLALTVTHA